MDLKMQLDLIRFYNMPNNRPNGALRNYKKENPCNTSSIVKLIQKFEKTYSLHDLTRSGRKSLLCERILAIKEAIDATSNENQSTSIRKFSRSTGVSSDSVHQVMRK